MAVASSLGQFAYDAGTRAHFTTVVMGNDSSGYAERAAVDAATIDVEALAREAVDKSVRSRSPVAAPPGEYRVVLEPYAVDMVQPSSIDVRLDRYFRVRDSAGAFPP